MLLQIQESSSSGGGGSSSGGGGGGGGGGAKILVKVFARPTWQLFSKHPITILHFLGPD